LLSVLWQLLPHLSQRHQQMLVQSLLQRQMSEMNVFVQEQKLQLAA
jgi:hypothetical protein